MSAPNPAVIEAPRNISKDSARIAVLGNSNAKVGKVEVQSEARYTRLSLLSFLDGLLNHAEVRERNI